MQRGDSAHFLAGHGPPLKDDLTLEVAAALACGFRFVGGASFVWTVEEVKGEPKQETRWAFNSATKAEFPKPDGTTETLSLGEFLKRLRDHAWCEANQDHPIAYLAAFIAQFSRIRADLRGMKPALVLRKGKSCVIIPEGAPEEKKAELLKMFES